MNAFMRIHIVSNFLRYESKQFFFFFFCVFYAYMLEHFFFWLVCGGYQLRINKKIDLHLTFSTKHRQAKMPNVSAYYLNRLSPLGLQLIDISLFLTVERSPPLVLSIIFVNDRLLLHSTSTLVMLMSAYPWFIGNNLGSLTLISISYDSPFRR